MSKVQLDIDFARAERDAGILQAETHANQVDPGWSEKAFGKLIEFLQIFTGPFQAEEVRSFAAVDDDFPEPPSRRAWGSVIVRAVRAGLIKQIGYKKVRNPKAHCANSALWQKV